jgi:ribosome-associated protein
LQSSTVAKRIGELALTKKANEVVIMDLRKISPVADYFVVCSADSDVQVKAIAEEVEDGMKKEGNPPWHRETTSSNWMILDFVDVVLHVFHKQTRPFYNLEKLWGDAKIQKLAESVRSSRAKKKTARPVKASRKKSVSSTKIRRKAIR